MPHSTVELDLRDVSKYRVAGTQQSEGIQQKLLDSFVDKLCDDLPQGATIGRTKPLENSWRVPVLFADRATDTNVYRQKIIRTFPYSTVASARDGGDLWNLPYSSGIRSRASPCGTFVLVCIVALVIYGVTKLPSFL